MGRGHLPDGCRIRLRRHDHHEGEQGGGTWNYGTVLDGIYKGCYSNYIHPTKQHSASVSIGNATDKVIKNADIWANAYATSGAAHTCNAYWNTY